MLAKNIHDFTNLHQMISDGYITIKRHPALPLFIYNYTHRAQYQSVWDETTLQCRGLVCDDSGNIVARPFRKFFNLSELKVIPDEVFDVYEKYDGSMVSVFYYAGEWIVASRGSFVSEQAIKAKELLWQSDVNSLVTGYTYVFEVIYPENRIVVDYGDKEDLILIGAFRTGSGREVDIDLFAEDGFTVAKRYPIANLDNLLEFERRNAEGFVIRFESGLRAKVKYDEYVRLHRIVSGTNEHSIWEALSSGISLDKFTENVPDEFYAWVKEVSNRMTEQYRNILIECLELFSTLRGDTRKELALQYIQTEYAKILFAMLDQRDYSKMIWSLIEPKGEIKNEL